MISLHFPLISPSFRKKWEAKGKPRGNEGETKGKRLILNKAVGTDRRERGGQVQLLYLGLEKIRCASIPVVKGKKGKLKAEQILNWWSEFEQASLAQALKYRMMFSTDVTDCYGSIYTHSIAWALHGKDVAKEGREDGTLLGNMIDKRIQAMRFGQTNGILQGSVLMDFIADFWDRPQKDCQ